MPRTVRANVTRTTVVCWAVAAIAATALAGCGHSNPGLGRLTVNGQVEVASGQERAHAAASGDTVRAGDQVHVVSGGGAIRLTSSGLLEMRAGTILTIDKSSRLTKGAVLIEPANQPVRVSAQNATLVVPSGAAQLAMASPLQGVTAKTYQDKSTLEIPGNPAILIAAPREVRLTPDVKLPIQATPLNYDDTDGWDRQYLAPEVAVSKQLAAAAAGFDAQLAPNDGMDAAFYQKLLPGLDGNTDFPATFAAIQKVQSSVAVKPGDYLIASVIALRGTREIFAARLTEALIFARQGAPWGFVAHDQGVTDLNGVLNDVLAAIRRAQLPYGAPSAIALAPQTTAPPSASTTPSSGRSTPTTAATTVPRNNRPQTTSPPTTVTGPPLVQLPAPNLPPPLGTILNPLLDPLIALLNSILGGGKH